MRRSLVLVVLAAAGLFLLPFAQTAQTATPGPNAPPMGQDLVREGDFAVSLVEALNLGETDDEAVAESRLADSGIAPRNGWVADYPVTPDILDELYASIKGAADEGRLQMARADALRELNNLAAQYGLPIPSEPRNEYAQGEPPAEYEEYPDSAALDDYYSTQGPPVVTYYDPPDDYGYMYSYVPYPFWYSSFYFPGFFVLHDFHSFRKVVVVRKHHHRHAFKRVTNHVFDRNRGRHARLDPVNRLKGKRGNELSDARRTREFRNADARRGAESILRRESERGRGSRNEGPGRRDGPANALNDRSRDRVLNNGSNSGGRGDGNARRPEFKGPARGFQGERVGREVNRGATGRSERFGNSGSGRSGNGDGRSFRTVPRETGNFRTFRNDSGSRGFSGGSFSRGGNSGNRSFSRGGSSGGRSFSSGGGFGNRGSSGGGGFSRGGGSSRSGGGGFSRGGGGSSRSGGGGCRRC